MNLSWDSVDRKINGISVDEYLRGAAWLGDRGALKFPIVESRAGMFYAASSSHSWKTFDEGDS